MTTQQIAVQPASNLSASAQVTLLLTVRNHPGVMSHICGLFARRAFNVEGILCMPLAGGDESRIWLQVLDDQRLLQMISQLEKLEDVLQVHRFGPEMPIFNQVEDLIANQR
ncbi:acetolactate synthase small subunit [Yersinia intermedia]|jgi:acetolactate synthase-1/3 small subunit|uniref:acetolactate synthase small subunit n=1 Tax=Yersinia intermedia TaxID=631 RepID=UPI0005E8D473|nr:acetolactate synthase small subunit [Yersinia intermedia]MCB5311629.1 acetolactate synthase small subunit [Yersinia intermedia]MCB5325494.1 acetolactate synthase small subunit [Yersinia intermedia]UNK21455.1 acetolactate synthase small subunit [Yersinia intermedia]UZM73012.1 acetolactate synthase small subunit [Yersinia intermedia]WET13702.1 acetolactate synthase small subunit [Yersinia intermedia]